MTLKMQCDRCGKLATGTHPINWQHIKTGILVNAGKDLCSDCWNDFLLFLSNKPQ